MGNLVENKLIYRPKWFCGGGLYRIRVDGLVGEVSGFLENGILLHKHLLMELLQDLPSIFERSQSVAMSALTKSLTARRSGDFLPPWSCPGAW